MPTIQEVQTTSAADVRHPVRVRRLSPAQIDPLLTAQWRFLETRALEPNPFLSPHFVLPAIEHLTPRAGIAVLAFETTTELGADLVGIGVFEESAGTRLAPLPHMRAYLANSNTFLTGLLVDPHRSQDVLQALFDYAQQQGGAWKCLEFQQRTKNTELDEQFEIAAKRAGFHWQGWEFQRPLFFPHQLTEESLQQSLSKNRRKKLRRNHRGLQSQGRLTFEVIRSRANMMSHADEFLRLEDSGWKGEEGSSLKSSAGSTAFFHEVVSGFAHENRMIFTELRLDDRVIGSTANFVAGQAGFAFKSGWDPDYRAFSPGIQQEFRLACSDADSLSDLDYFDSGTDMNSWMESVWPATRTVTSGFFTSSSFSRLVVSQMLRLRDLKRTVSDRVRN